MLTAHHNLLMGCSHAIEHTRHYAPNTLSCLSASRLLQHQAMVTFHYICTGLPTTHSHPRCTRCRHFPPPFPQSILSFTLLPACDLFQVPLPTSLRKSTPTRPPHPACCLQQLPGTLQWHAGLLRARLHVRCKGSLETKSCPLEPSGVFFMAP